MDAKEINSAKKINLISIYSSKKFLSNNTQKILIDKCNLELEKFINFGNFRKINEISWNFDNFTKNQITYYENDRGFSFTKNYHIDNYTCVCYIVINFEICSDINYIRTINSIKLKLSI